MDKSLSFAARALLFSAGGLAVVAGPILFLFPEQTASYFAWTIKHPLTPVFMGANYLGGLGALWTLALNRWSVARVQLPGIFVFAVTQLLATLLHIPVFNWQHPVAWAWLFVYLTSPVAALWVYLSMERSYGPPAAAGPGLPRAFAVTMYACAAVSAGLGVALFLWPFLPSAGGGGGAVPWWAWTLTPLTAHVAGGWYLAAAALQLTLARQHEIGVMGPSLLGLMIVTGAQLIGAVLHAGDFNGSPLFIALYLLNAASVFLYAAYLFVRARTALSVAGSRVSS